MRHAFYESEEYRAKQRERTKRNQDRGVYRHLKKEVTRQCDNDLCRVTFTTQPSNKKRFCSKSCVAQVTNRTRLISAETREKMARAQRGKTSPFKGLIKTDRISKECLNPTCKKIFLYERHRTRSFCSRRCSQKTIGGRTTSPKASRGKAGIRSDIDATTYFYSRWEANVARLYTYLGVRWVFEPKTFDIGNQTYTPDFYLPDEDTYIEVKNYWSEYSRIRDEKFRAVYPHLSLRVILKDEYRALEKRYAKDIPHWEYKNSPFN